MTAAQPDASTAVSVAKVYASDACREVGNRGVQVQGGMGFTWENDTHLYYRRAKSSEIAFGDATFHRERIARLVIDQGSHQRIPRNHRYGMMKQDLSRPTGRTCAGAPRG